MPTPIHRSYQTQEEVHADSSQNQPKTAPKIVNRLVNLRPPKAGLESNSRT